MNGKILGSLATVAVVFVLVMAIGSASAVASSIDRRGVAWDHTPTVEIKLQKGVDPSFRDVAIDALDAWVDTLGAKFEYTLQASLVMMYPEPNPKPPSPPGKDKDKNGDADITITLKKNGGVILGSAQTFSEGGIIQEVKIKVLTKNAVGLPLDASDVFTITAHELGHAWSLGHADDDGVEPIDLMAPGFDFTESNVRVNPSTCDLDAVKSIYGNDGFGKTNTPSSSPFICK